MPPEPGPPAAGRHCRVVLHRGPGSAKAARDFTTATLRDWELGALTDEAVVIASELVTNAIRHGSCLAADAGAHTLVELAWQRHDDRVTCVVTDQNTRPPVLAAPSDPHAESGRGLWVVQALAADWGWMMLGPGAKAVWADLCLELAGLRR